MDATYDVTADSTTYDDAVRRLLGIVRAQLGMDVAWLSEFVGDQQVLRYVDAAPGARAPAAGSVVPLSSTFCARVLAGTFPPVIPDSRREPDAALLNEVSGVSIGSYVGVPLLSPAGTATGMLCTVSDGPTPRLSDRDLGSLRRVASLLDDLQRRAVSETEAAASQERLRFVLRTVVEGRGRHAVLQPVVDLTTGDAELAEGLTRFTLPSPTPSGAATTTVRSPAQWFDDARRLGMSGELELAAARAVLDLLDGDAVPADRAVSVNLSPETVQGDGFAELVRGRDLGRVVVELTEHAPVPDYDALAAALAPYRLAGLRVAVDDAGAGYASLRHVLAVKPDLAKIDMALVRSADTDVVRRTLLSALAVFADAVGCRLVAEGVETAGELAAVRDCGIGYAQGHLLAEPSTAPPWDGFRVP